MNSFVHRFLNIPFIEFNHDGQSDIFVPQYNPVVIEDESYEPQPDYKAPQYGGFQENNNPNFECNTTDYPLFDPNYFDEFCSHYYWCWKEYDPINCEPVSARGLTVF